MRRQDRRTSADRAYPQRVRLFRNGLLERLTVMPPQLFAVTWSTLLLVILWAGSGATRPLAWIGLVLLGLFAWSLFEYGMHRFIFHMDARSRIGRRIGFVMHGNHHLDPNDPGRSMMPLVVSIPWSGMIWGLLVLLFGHAGSVFFLGFAIGYVAYDSVHHACHQLPVRGALLRALRRHHLRHHFGRQQGHYAITATVWDRLFGSAPVGDGVGLSRPATPDMRTPRS